MDEKQYTELAVHVQEVDSRCKSNEHRIDDHDNAISELRNRQEAIYDLTSSVKSIAQDMSYIKEDVGEVKAGACVLLEQCTCVYHCWLGATDIHFDIFSIDVIHKAIIFFL